MKLAAEPIAVLYSEHIDFVHDVSSAEDIRYIDQTDQSDISI